MRSEGLGNLSNFTCDLRDLSVKHLFGCCVHGLFRSRWHWCMDVYFHTQNLFIFRNSQFELCILCPKMYNQCIMYADAAVLFQLIFPKIGHEKCLQHHTLKHLHGFNAIDGGNKSARYNKWNHGTLTVCAIALGKK